MSARTKQVIFSVLICLIGFTATLYAMQDTKPTEKKAEYELKCQETFAKLRKMFPNSILDKDFKTLKQVTSSKAYLDFLKQAYPREKPFETLNELVVAKMNTPPVKRYETFLNKHFKHLTDADFQSIHLLTLIYRRTDIIMQLAEQTKDQKAMHQKAMRKALMQKIFIYQKDPVKAWWKSRISRGNEAKKMAFLLELEKFATETQKLDTDWIQAQFEAHGQENAMLWLAIRNPLLIGEILMNFNRTDTFLAWVKQTWILKKLTEIEKL